MSNTYARRLYTVGTQHLPLLLLPFWLYIPKDIVVKTGPRVSVSDICTLPVSPLPVKCSTCNSGKTHTHDGIEPSNVLKRVTPDRGSSTEPLHALAAPRPSIDNTLTLRASHIAAGNEPSKQFRDSATELTIGSSNMPFGILPLNLLSDKSTCSMWIMSM